MASYFPKITKELLSDNFAIKNNFKQLIDTRPIVKEYLENNDFQSLFVYLADKCTSIDLLTVNILLILTFGFDTVQEKLKALPTRLFFDSWVYKNAVIEISENIQFIAGECFCLQDIRAVWIPKTYKWRGTEVARAEKIDVYFEDENISPVATRNVYAHIGYSKKEFEEIMKK